MKLPKLQRWRSAALQLALVLAVVWGVQAYQSRDIPAGMAPPVYGVGLDGRPLDLAALRGRPAVVHFWATWCTVCRLEQHNIDAIASDHPMIAVATQSGGAEEVARVVAQRDIRMPVLVDEAGVFARRYGVKAFPTTLVVDGEGHIRHSAIGYTTEWGLRLRLWLARW